MMWIVLMTLFLSMLSCTPGTIKDEQPCGIGWRHFKGMCYSIRVSPKTWLQSRDDCEERDSELIKLTNNQELSYVYNTFIRPLHGRSAWIGLTKAGDHFEWVDGSRLTYKNWNEGEPNNYGGKEKCVELFVKSGEWNDIECTQLRPSLCKKGIDIKHPETLISTTLSNMNFSLKGFTIETITGLDVMGCATLCFAEPDCYSINFASNLDKCELNNSTKATAGPGSFVFSPGYIYYD